jgi:hypothetical protein
MSTAKFSSDAAPSATTRPPIRSARLTIDLDHCAALGIFARAPHEISIEFEVVGVATEHHPVVEMSQANIVERDANAGIAQCSDRIQQPGNVVSGSVLDDLGRESLQRERTLLRRWAEKLKEARALTKG